MDNFLVQKFLSVDLFGLMLTLGSLRSFGIFAILHFPYLSCGPLHPVPLAPRWTRNCQKRAERSWWTWRNERCSEWIMAQRRCETNKKRPSTGHDRTPPVEWDSEIVIPIAKVQQVVLEDSSIIMSDHTQINSKIYLTYARLSSWRIKTYLVLSRYPMNLSSH